MEEQYIDQLIQTIQNNSLYENVSSLELKQILLSHKPNVYIIQPDGKTFHYTLPLHLHHYNGYLMYLEYLTKKDIEKHKSVVHFLNMDFSKNPRAGVLLTTKLGNYFQSLGDIVIQTWLNPYDMNAYFMSTELNHATDLQNDKYQQILREHHMEEIEPIENSRLGILRKKEVLMATNKKSML